MSKLKHRRIRSWKWQDQEAEEKGLVSVSFLLGCLTCLSISAVFTANMCMRREDQWIWSVSGTSWRHWVAYFLCLTSSYVGDISPLFRTFYVLMSSAPRQMVLSRKKKSLHRTLSYHQGFTVPSPLRYSSPFLISWILQILQFKLKKI